MNRAVAARLLLAVTFLLLAGVTAKRPLTINLQNLDVEVCPYDHKG